MNGNNDSAKNDLFMATVLLINEEGQRIWNRYHVMLAANAIITTLIGTLISNTTWGNYSAFS